MFIKLYKEEQIRGKMKGLPSTEILQQALELNGIDKEKARKVTEEYIFLLAAEETLEKAEKRKGKRIENEKERKELRRLLSAKLRTEGEILAYKLFKEENLL